ncbi:unnamed protein product, partial [Nesidiocoris tenuis]
TVHSSGSKGKAPIADMTTAVDTWVEASDTLTSVAARFDTTPSELCKINRLAARTVFPGQVIRVPVKSSKTDKGEGDDDGGDRVSQTTSTERSENTDEEDMLDTLRVNSPKPGHAERVGTPSSPHLEKFLRINVRHITDGQSDTQDTTADDKSPLNDDEDLNRAEEPSKVEGASAPEDTSRVDAEALIRATEERRRSVLDQHWAVPKHSIDEPQPEPEPPVLEEGRRDSEGHLVKLSCHDSGIDIRDPPPPAPTQRKTVYSDADILLAGDGEFLPPVPVVPLPPAPSSADDEKKKQSVSFSIDDEPKVPEDDKQETKKNKVQFPEKRPLKRSFH